MSTHRLKVMELFGKIRLRDKSRTERGFRKPNFAGGAGTGSSPIKSLEEKRSINCA
jgi:hypothetical protein